METAAREISFRFEMRRRSRRLAIWSMFLSGGLRVPLFLLVEELVVT